MEEIHIRRFVLFTDTIRECLDPPRTLMREIERNQGGLGLRVSVCISALIPHGKSFRLSGVNISLVPFDF